MSDARLGRELSAVREALNRILRAGVVAVLVVAVLGAGLMLEPLQSSARVGGFVAGHATFKRGGFHRFVGQPLVRPGQSPPVVESGERGDCRSEPRIVPSEAGGERQIRITWCRKG
jgi:hypothetical protein